MHEHAGCEHKDLKYCPHCKVVYCERCGKEWHEYSYSCYPTIWYGGLEHGFYTEQLHDVYETITVTCDHNGT